MIGNTHYYVDNNHQYFITPSGEAEAKRKVTQITRRNTEATRIATDTLAGAFWQPRENDNYTSWT